MVIDVSPAGQQLRIALVSDGPPRSEYTNSGVAIGVLSALHRRTDVLIVGEIDGSLRGARRFLVLLLALRPSVRRTRAVFTKGKLSIKLRSKLVERGLRRLLTTPDVVLLIRNIYLPLDFPYAVYLDNTIALTQRDWQDWALPAREYKWRFRIDRAQFSDATCVLTTGRNVADSLVSDFGVDSDRIEVVGNGLRSLPAPLSAREEDKCDAVTIIFVGLEFRRKGGDLLVEAFRTATTSVQARLLIVGGANVAAVKNVQSVGRITDKRRLADLYDRADIFVLPARFEPYGLVVKEAMSRGCACIVSNVGAMTEIIDHERDGLIVNKGDIAALRAAIERLVDDSDFRQYLGRRAQEKMLVGQNWDDVASRMVTALRPCTTGYRE